MPVRYLGFKIALNLDWSTHIDEITEKLLVLLSATTDLKNTKLTEQPQKTEVKQQQAPSKSLFLTHFGDTGPAKMAVSIGSVF